MDAKVVEITTDLGVLEEIELAGRRPGLAPVSRQAGR